MNFLLTMQTFAPKGSKEILAAAADLPTMAKWGISGRLRLCHFLAHCFVESDGFTKLEENMNYSAGRMQEVWPSRFPSLAKALPFAHNPQALANKVYNGRMGNKVGTNDGWEMRGLGLLQNTGRDNRAALGHLMQIDLFKIPSPLVVPETMLACACVEFIRLQGLKWADRDDIVNGTKAINGGLTGLQDRKNALAKIKTLILA